MHVDRGHKKKGGSRVGGRAARASVIAWRLPRDDSKGQADGEHESVDSFLSSHFFFVETNRGNRGISQDLQCDFSNGAICQFEDENEDEEGGAAAMVKELEPWLR